MLSDSSLSPELYYVARERGTEAPFSGAYLNKYEPGLYTCAVCGHALFSSNAKFDSGTGWPSFRSPIKFQQIELKSELSQGLNRVEVVCRRCGAHLGHVFDDGPKDKGGKRYCINSISLNFYRPGDCG